MAPTRTNKRSNWDKISTISNGKNVLKVLRLQQKWNFTQSIAVTTFDTVLKTILIEIVLFSWGQAKCCNYYGKDIVRTGRVNLDKF